MNASPTEKNAKRVEIYKQQFFSLLTLFYPTPWKKAIVKKRQLLFGEYPRLTKEAKWIILYFVRFPKSSKI